MIAWVWCPAVLYFLAHYLGFLYPELLWGVDQLAYYPKYTGPAVLGGGIAWWALYSGSSRSQRVQALLHRITSGIARDRRIRTALVSLGLLGFVVAAWGLRVQEHYLGDAGLWFRNLQMAREMGFSAAREFMDLRGLELVPFAEPLDVLLHLGIYLSLSPVIDCQPADVYAVVSVLSGLLWVVLSWQLTGYLFPDTVSRWTAFLQLVTLGNMQLFMGYAESYSIVAPLSLLFLLTALRSLQTGSVLLPSITLCFAASFHLQALSLSPVLVYVFWSRLESLRGYITETPGRRRAACAFVAILLIAGYWLYPYRLPLLVTNEPGRYTALSWQHLLNLINLVLLLSPFGLIHTVAGCLSRVPTSRHGLVLLWSAAGTTALVVSHDVILGGRDWDLLSFAAPYYSLLGVYCLTMAGRRDLLRATCTVIVPIMLVHSLLWIGIGTRPEAAQARVGRLISSSNLAPHYRDVQLGIYHESAGRLQQATLHYASCIRAAPSTTEEERFRRVGYQLFLVDTWLDLEDAESAIRVLTSVLVVDIQGAASTKRKYHMAWARASKLLAAAERSRGNRAEAEASYSEALHHLRMIPSEDETARTLYLETQVLLALGRDTEAEAALRRAYLHLGPEERQNLDPAIRRRLEYGTVRTDSVVTPFR